MVVNRNIDPSRVKKSRLLAVYIPLILDYEGVNLSPELIKIRLQKDFNYSVSLDEILNYLQPNYYEIRADLEQQMKNLDIRYG